MPETMTVRLNIGKEKRFTIVTIHIIRSARKSVALEIKPDMTVNVRAPLKMSDKAIHGFVEQKQHWLTEKYALMEAQRMSGEEKNPYYHGAVLPLENGTITLCMIKERPDRRRLEDGGQANLCDAFIQAEYGENDEKKLIIRTLSEEENFIRACVIDWYRQYAERVFLTDAEAKAKEMGVNFNRICIREQKSRWGSCSSKGNLNFNWKLILMPVRIREYVIVHELAHLRQMNHSPAFWMEVEKIIPDFRERRHWLKLHGQEYECY